MAARSRRAEETDTRTRLLEAAMQLFAERGYDGTTVGEIERAAGLAPRSGALYQYFSGKEELLRAAVERELSAVDELSSMIETLTPGDLRSGLTRLAEWNLASLARRQALNRFLARDADRLPPALKAKLYDRLVAQPYEQVFDLLRGQLTAAERRRFDVEALALIFIQAMAGYRSMQATFGKVVGNVDDERFVKSWVEVALAVVRDPATD